MGSDAQFRNAKPSATDAQGNTTAYGLDNLGQTVSQTTADNKTTTYAYNVFGELVGETDPLTQTSTNIVDAVGRVFRTIQPNPDGTNRLPEEHHDDASYTPSGGGNPAVWDFTVTAGRQFLVIAKYGEGGSFTAWSGSTQLTWDGDSTPAAKDVSGTQIDAQNKDSYWQVVGVVSADGAGTLSLHLSGAGDSADGIYLLETLPQTYYAYDAMDNVIAQTDALGHTTHYAYDAMGRKESETDPNGQTTGYEYDLAGRNTGVTDPDGNVTHFDYDDLGQLRHETITVGATQYTRSYDYNLVGQPTQYTDRDGRVTLFDYDDLGRKIAERWYDESNTLVNTVTTHYDILGRVHSVGDDFSSTTYDYDLKDRPVSETIDNAGTPTVVLATGYAANSLGQAARTDALRTTLSAAIGPQGSATPDFQNLYHYDPLDRMDKVGQTGQTGGNAVASKLATLQFDDAGRLEYIRRYADLGATTLAVASHYTFDAADRLTALTHYHTSETADKLAGYSWDFDGAGRLERQASGWQNGQTWTTDGVNYGYDARGQLTGAVYDSGSPLANEGYEYDANGNRESVTIGGTTDTYAAPDPYNHVRSDGTFTYEYDDEGNRTARFVWTDANSNGLIDAGEKSQITAYKWDNRDRLVKMTDRATESGSATQVVDYVYDAFNRRIGSLYDTNGDAAVDREERYVWDGQNVVLDFVDPDGGNNGENSAPLALDRRYLTGFAVDQVFAQETADDGGPEDVLWMLADHEGSNRDLAVYNGADTSVVSHYTIDSYGNATATVGSLSDTRYVWAQTQYDLTTGQYYALNRWYDPHTGGWESEDPKGFGAGDANLARYVGNMPTNAVDPSGTVIVLIHGVNTDAAWFADAKSGLADYRKAAKSAFSEEIIEFKWGDPGTWGSLGRKQGGHPNYATDNVADLDSTGWMSKERQYMGDTVKRLKIVLDGLNRIKQNTGAKESISVIAHSQGTILTLGALQKGARIDNFIMMGSPLDIWPYDKANNDLLKAKSGIRGETFNYWSPDDEWAWQKGGIGAYGNDLHKIKDLNWIQNRKFGPGNTNLTIHGYSLPSTGEFAEYDHSDYMAKAEFFARIHGVDLGSPADDKISKDSGIETLRNIAKNW